MCVLPAIFDQLGNSSAGWGGCVPGKSSVAGLEHPAKSCPNNFYMTLTISELGDESWHLGLMLAYISLGQVPEILESSPLEDGN